MDSESGNTSALLVKHYSLLRQKAKRVILQRGKNSLIDPTELLHQAVVENRRSSNQEPRRAYGSTREFIAAMLRRMEYSLISDYRRRTAQKRGGGQTRIPLEVALDRKAECDDSDDSSHRRTAMLAELLREMAQVNPVATDVIRLRFFDGLTEQEAANHLAISRTRTQREAKFAKEWLQRRLKQSDSTSAYLHPTH
ncbi:MAG: sigma-70 family RNA polymerase sigma factor [Planctomycetales bacterium]|nr:sigma-70 family RNA polymerase sigma factor [Planctomycetales bacterium]